MAVFGDEASPTSDFVKSTFNSGQLILLMVLLFIAVFAVFLVIMYFARKKIPKADRKAKVLRFK